MAAMRWAMILEQLVEGLRVLREEVAEALHELLEARAPRPRSRCSSIWLSSASMSFMRCMSSGDMFCIAPDIWLT